MRIHADPDPGEALKSKYVEIIHENMLELEVGNRSNNIPTKVQKPFERQKTRFIWEKRRIRILDPVLQIPRSRFLPYQNVTVLEHSPSVCTLQTYLTWCRPWWASPRTRGGQTSAWPRPGPRDPRRGPAGWWPGCAAACQNATPCPLPAGPSSPVFGDSRLDLKNKNHLYSLPTISVADPDG